MKYLSRSLSAFMYILLAAIQPPAMAQSAVGPGLSEHRPRVAVALGGGGTRGAAHVGVLRVLQSEGVPIDIVVGTSIGAIVGGLFCAGVNTDTIEQIFTKKSLLKAFYTVPIPVRIIAIPVFATARVFGYRPYDGFYRGGVFANFLNNSVPGCERKIEDLKIPFTAVCTNLLDGKPCLISSGNLGRALQASAAVPVLRQPVEFDTDKLLVDGGLMANLPVRQARAMGGDIVIAVDVDERFSKVGKEVFRRPGSVSRRLVTMMLASEDAQQIAAADVAIHPEVDGIGLLSTKVADARAAIAAGEKAAHLALPAIRQRLADFKADLVKVDTSHSVVTNPPAEHPPVNSTAQPAD